MARSESTSELLGEDGQHCDYYGTKTEISIILSGAKKKKKGWVSTHNITIHNPRRRIQMFMIYDKEKMEILISKLANKIKKNTNLTMKIFLFSCVRMEVQNIAIETIRVRPSSRKNKVGVTHPLSWCLSLSFDFFFFLLFLCFLECLASEL